MLEFTVPVLLGACLIGVVVGLIISESPIAFLISGYAAVAVFVATILFLELGFSSHWETSDWLFFIVFLGVWSIIVFFVASVVGFATSSLIWRRSHRR
jgi:hypothetical protein